MKSWLEQNKTEMYSTHNEKKIVVPERIIRNLKNKSYKYMTSISKNVYIVKLDDIVNKYNNTYNSINKMKLVDLNQINILTLVKKLLMKILNLKLVILLEYHNFRTFRKILCSKLVKKVFVITKVKNTVPWRYVIIDLKDRKIFEMFYKKELQKANQKEVRVEKGLIIPMSNGKTTIIILTARSIKQTEYK